MFLCKTIDVLGSTPSDKTSTGTSPYVLLAIVSAFLAISIAKLRTYGFVTVPTSGVAIKSNSAIAAPAIPRATNE